MTPPRIIFMGTPGYAVPYLEGLISTGLTPVAVFAQPDRPVGRGHTVQSPPVKRTAEKHSIPVFQPEKIREPQWIEKIRELSPDLIVVVAFGQIIPQAILDMPARNCINMHPSLLPRHRGAAPLQETILSGDTESAVTIMLMDEHMDHGPILRQERFTIDPAETYDTLCQKTITIGVPLLTSTLKDWLDVKITPNEQDHTCATYTRMLTRDAGKIDWSKSADEIDRMVRALNPWPGTWTKRDGRRLKILKTQTVDIAALEHTRLGELIAENSQLLVACGKGYVEIGELQPEGSRRMNAKDFINGGYLTRFGANPNSLS
jgi:methionyl-tRNA formyltransferase